MDEPTIWRAILETPVDPQLTGPLGPCLVVTFDDYNRVYAKLQLSRAEALELRERVAFLESPEVCAAAHDDVSECGYCQRDRLRAERDALRAALEWYRDEAVSLAKNMPTGAHTQAVLASLTVLSLDGGRRADAALAARGKASE